MASLAAPEIQNLSSIKPRIDSEIDSLVVRFQILKTLLPNNGAES